MANRAIFRDGKKQKPPKFSLLKMTATEDRGVLLFRRVVGCNRLHFFKDKMITKCCNF
jgi:hypothetical protein